MKISWISIIGVLLAVSSGYIIMTNTDNFGDQPFAGFIFLISLVYVVFGALKRFQNSMIKISLVLFAIAGGVNFFVLTMFPLKESINYVRLIIMFIGAMAGFCFLFAGFIYWIIDEIKARRNQNN